MSDAVATRPDAPGRALAWAPGTLGLVLAIGLPLLLAAAPPIATALGSAGWVALVSSAVLSVVVLTALVYAQARREGGARLRRAERALLLSGSIAAFLVIAIFPVQLSVFALAWPPPEGAQAYFDLLETRPIVGLLSLDLLLMMDWIVLLVMWGGLYVPLRATAPRAMLAALALVVVSTLAYFASNTAFDMMTLSAQHAAAATEAERAALLAAGDDALARFEGAWFTASYILSGLAALLASVVMWRDPRFGKIAGGVGVAYGLLQLVPPNAGMAGMAMSLASLPLMLVWLGMIAWKLLALGRARPMRRLRVRQPGQSAG